MSLLPEIGMIFINVLLRFYPVMKKLGINYYEDDAMNEKEFVPSNEKACFGS